MQPALVAGPARVALALVAVLAVAGCGGSSGSAAPRATVTPVVCPSATGGSTAQWPASVPADLPKPPQATIDDTSTEGGGVHITKFTTPSSLRESVLFVVQQLPKAGYVLGRGDAEPLEADAPFVRGDLRGLIRMVSAGDCRTQWLLATVDTSAGSSGGSPLLPTHSPSGSTSPLPFG